VTVDGDSVKNKDVTIRNRDDCEQKRVKISELGKVFDDLILSQKRFSEL